VKVIEIMKNKTTILELHEKLVNKELTVEQLVRQAIIASQKEEPSNFLITNNYEQAIIEAKKLDEAGIDESNLLYGIPYFTKDLFATKGLATTAGSKILEDFKPTYNATNVELLAKQKMILLGKANLDELAMGGTGLSSAYGKIYNPLNKEHLVGGSSSGSAYAVAANLVPFATGTDTGDSIRKPASFVGIFGFKPTYGAISRYGLMPYAPSLDHAGILANSLEDVAIVADALIHQDQKDFTSVEIDKRHFYQNLENFDQHKAFGYLKQVHDVLPEKLKEKYEQLYQILSEAGYQVKAIDFRQDLLEALAPIYMMISFSEAVSSSANLSGINFGKRVEAESYEEIMKQTRSQKFGPVVKRRFIIGSLNLKQENQHIYLLKAKKVRRLINEELAKVFQQTDLLFLPSSPSVAPLANKAYEVDQNNGEYPEFLDDILMLGNFAGIPSLTIPFVSENDLPIGLTINA
jgi:aspartyl-tRNA(Asn)/glutamyl-tRNA(Gln) amidotransferase subunit A